jgi:hypothetical protein
MESSRTSGNWHPSGHSGDITTVKILFKLRSSTVKHYTMPVIIYLIRASPIVSKKSQLMSFPSD